MHGWDFPLVPKICVFLQSPLSRQCEIPWHGTTAHAKCYSYHAGTSVIVSGGGINATVHDPKPKWNAQYSKVKNGRKYAANNKQFEAISPDISLTFSKIPDSCQIPRHFQVFQTNGSPCFISFEAFTLLGVAVAVWVASRPEACRLSQLQGCGFESAPLTSIA